MGATLTSPGSTLHSVCSTSPKIGVGSSLGGGDMKVDGEVGGAGLCLSPVSFFCEVGWSFGDLCLSLGPALPWDI